MIKQDLLKSSLIIIILIIGFLIIPGELKAQRSSANIAGVIAEAVTGEVLIGANILIYSDSLRTNAPIRGTATNRFGFYSFPNVPLGTYYIFASSIGYETKMLECIVTSAAPQIRIDIILEKATIELQAVVVEDKKTDFQPTISTIEVEPMMVKQLPSLGGETDVFRALQLLPGVTAATEISTGIYVRGGSPDQNLTLVDGVIVYNPSHLGGFASTFNSDALQNIKLLKGGFPAEYGGRLSSVLDVTLREGTKEKFIGSGSLNLFSTRLTIEGPLSDNATYIFSGRKMFLDKILPLIPNTDVIPRYDFYDFNGKVNYVLSETDRIFISGFFSRDNLKEPPSSKDVGFDISWGNSTVNLTWTKINSHTLFTNTSLMYTNYNFSTLLKDKQPVDSPLDFFTSSTINDFLIKREMQIFPYEGHTVKTGAEITYHSFSTTTSDFFVRELLYNSNYGTTISALEAALYVQDEWQISRRLNANFGGRAYYFHSNKQFQFEPRISATYLLFDRLTLRAAAAVSHQFLHMIVRNDISLPTDVWYPSTKEINPAKAYQGVFGFESISFDKSYLFSAEVYYKKMENLYEYNEQADFSIDNPFESQLVKGDGEAYGIEFFLNKRTGKLTGWLGYTVAWTKRFFDDLNQGLSFYPRYDRRHDISVVLTYQLGNNWDFGATWTYGTGQAYSLPIGQYTYTGFNNPFTNTKELYYDYSARDAFRLPPFHKLDLSTRYRFNWDGMPIELSLSIYNAYNRNNPFSKYIGYNIDEATGERIPILKQFTLFPFLPTIGINVQF